MNSSPTLMLIVVRVVAIEVWPIAVGENAANITLASITLPPVTVENVRVAPNFVYSNALPVISVSQDLMFPSAPDCNYSNLAITL